jgi:hypothetical protein
MFCHRRKLFVFVIAAMMCMGFTTMMFKNPDCPTGFTGAPGATSGQVKYCTNCHNDFALNTAGGSVVATGLPSGNYIPGQTYNFSIKISHGSANMSIWGFAVKAVNKVDNQVVGTFATTNANVTVKGSAGAQDLELSHGDAPTTALASNYTFLNLKWTAPASPQAKESQIRFYITGMPGDFDDATSGDYVYTSTVDATLGALPVSLVSFKAIAQHDNQVALHWQTAQEINTTLFELEASANNADWNKVATISAKGNVASAQSYAFTDKNPIAFGSNIYYRLKIVDKDGSFAYSAVQTILLKNAGIVIQSLSPQPLRALSKATFRIQSDSRKSIAVAVSDISGRLLFKTNKWVEVGSQIVEIPGDKIAFSRGLVIVNFRAEGLEKTFKLWIE